MYGLAVVPLRGSWQEEQNTCIDAAYASYLQLGDTAVSNWIPISLVILVVAACGCAQTGLHLRSVAMHPPGGRWPDLSAATPYVLPESTSFGVSLGEVTAVRRKAAEGLHGSKFKRGMFTGINASYVFPMYPKGERTSSYVTRYGLELWVTDYDMRLSQGGFELGTLHITSHILAFKFLKVPEEEHFLGFHLDIGAGWAGTCFSKGSMLRAQDIAGGTHTDISVSSAGVFVAGGGVDIFFHPNFSASLDFRYTNIAVPVKWRVDGVPRPGTHWFYPSNQQLVISFRLFF